MPTTIPYDPSRALGNIVDNAVLQNLLDISAAHAPADAAEEKLNSLKAIKRSIDMTIAELANMRIDTASLAKESAELDDRIRIAGDDYAALRRKSVEEIKRLQDNPPPPNPGPYDSPVNQALSRTTTVPLTADALRMSVRYFAVDNTQRASSARAPAIEGFVAEKLSAYSAWRRQQTVQAIRQQIDGDYRRRDIAGSMVIVINCIHKNRTLISPLVLDADKAVAAWNSTHTANRIDTAQPEKVLLLAADADANPRPEKTLPLVYGATYGSYFIGMVHMTADGSNADRNKMDTIAACIERLFGIGSWAGNGPFSLDGEFSREARHLLSDEHVTGHCTFLTLDEALPDGGAGVADDTAGLMDVLDAYLRNAVDGKGGIALDQYLRHLTAAELAQMWLAKHYPDGYRPPEEEEKPSE